ncbi:MAG: hypothetical protein ABI479_03345 [Gallionella sp.]
MTAPLQPQRKILQFVFALLLFIAAVTPALVEGRTWPAITETPAGVYVHGRWVWGELLTEDAEAAKRFYGSVFGWSYQTLGEGKDTYTLARSAGDLVGGMIQRRHEIVKEKGSRWLGMISVPDVKLPRVTPWSMAAKCLSRPGR